MPNLLASVAMGARRAGISCSTATSTCSRAGTARAGRAIRSRATIVDGRVLGRGTVDMKCGTTASIFTYLYLQRAARRAARPPDADAGLRRGDRRALGQRLPGRAPRGRGARRLRPQRRAEQPLDLRFGEKAMFWMKFSRPHAGRARRLSARQQERHRIAAGSCCDLESLESLRPPTPSSVARALGKAATSAAASSEASARAPGRASSR